MQGKRTEDFWSYVNKTSTCWLWTGPLMGNYGWYSQHSTHFYAHRFSFIYLGGIIPKGKILHHKCINKLCVNPEHLEVIARGDHVDSGTGINRAKTHCPQGHEYTSDNIYLSNNCRTCKACTTERAKKAYKRKRLRLNIGVSNSQTTI